MLVNQTLRVILVVAFAGAKLGEFLQTAKAFRGKIT